jgi:hypothetical protein
MRLAVSVAILLLTVLDFRYGRPDDGLFLATLAAGVLLALSVVIDHLLPINGEPAEARSPADAPRAEMTDP